MFEIFGIGFAYNVNLTISDNARLIINSLYKTTDGICFKH